MTTMNGSLYGDFYQRTVATLHYIQWLTDPGNRYTPNLVSAHPEGVIVDQQLFTDRTRLAIYLNTTYVAKRACSDDELIPDCLGVPWRAAGPEDHPWLDYWCRQASRSIAAPFVHHLDAISSSAACRMPNIAATVALVQAYSMIGPSLTVNQRPTLFIPGQVCLIRAHERDHWFVANASHWNEKYLSSVPDPDSAGDLYGILVEVSTPHSPFNQSARPLGAAEVHDTTV